MKHFGNTTRLYLVASAEQTRIALGKPRPNKRQRTGVRAQQRDAAPEGPASEDDASDEEAEEGEESAAAAGDGGAAGNTTDQSPPGCLHDRQGRLLLEAVHTGMVFDIIRRAHVDSGHMRDHKALARLIAKTVRRHSCTTPPSPH